MAGIDWDKGLPLDLLFAVARGRDALKVMRQVSRTWKAGYEGSVTSIKLSESGPMIPPGGAFARRFPSVRSIELGDYYKPAESPDENIGRLVGAQITCLALSGPLTDSGLAQLREIPQLTRLSLRGCSKITDAGLSCLRGLLLQDLDLGGRGQLSPAGLAHLRGMPLSHLSLWRSWCLFAAPEALSQLSGMPITSLESKH